jgi:hypothetical protein
MCKHFFKCLPMYVFHVELVEDYRGLLANNNNCIMVTAQFSRNPRTNIRTQI